MKKHGLGPRVVITGLVITTRASRNRTNPRRQMIVRTDTGQELTGSIPASLRQTATTLTGRRIQFTALIDLNTQYFSYPEDGTVLAPDHMQHRAGPGTGQ